MKKNNNSMGTKSKYVTPIMRTVTFKVDKYILAASGGGGNSIPSGGDGTGEQEGSAKRINWFDEE